MIEIQNVTKVYGKQTVLSCVSATLEAGRIYGLVGINGSGKTTLLNVMADALHLHRRAEYNRTPFFEDYVRLCELRKGTIEEMIARCRRE